MEWPEKDKLTVKGVPYVERRVLRRGDEQIAVGHREWLTVLKLAFDYGWRPRGTQEPAHWEFNPWMRKKAGWDKRDYFTTQGQRVSDEDAQTMARALEEALPDIPEHDAVGEKASGMLSLPDRMPMPILPSGMKVNAFEYFSGKRRVKLGKLVDFLCGGEFVIC